ncbi:TPR-like protein [Dioscorea alata]|uniref:TPR-like protein n=3 Tax=Dioscorea alata TaxID=55571 RepID=A0ACB7WMA7_DIOAL|nr:TPR-like protein [Dioscorea alata]KAH7689111.1 TPR-like protein [Dioscorea alata]KAH7689112.1 TPR-like protein [Dioscorea alata]
MMSLLFQEHPWLLHPSLQRSLPRMALSLHSISTSPSKPLPMASIPSLSLNQSFPSFHLSPFLHSQESYSSILELCASHKAFIQGQQIHAHMLTSNALANDDGFLNTKLLFMYGKCGHLASAKLVFDEMPQRIVFAWNAMIGAYVSAGLPWEAVKLFRDMSVCGAVPDACTFASVLKACGEVGNICFGVEVHCLAVKHGLVSTTFVANALITMYAKCGLFDFAMKLFELMDGNRDVVSWNSIIAACLKDELFIEALFLFRKMLEAGIGTNSYNVVSALQACAELSLLKLGMQIHASVWKRGKTIQVHEANSLIVMYARCGRMDDATRVFAETSEKDYISWNSILSGCVQNGLNMEATSFFRELLEVGIKPDQVSVINIASALGRLGNTLNGMEVHAYSIKQGFESNLQLGNTLVDMYAKFSLVNYTERVFHKMPDKDYISWTTAIAALAQNHQYLEALELFREVQKEGMDVDPMMIGSILIACGGLKSLCILKQIHGYTIRHGLLDLLLENKIIDMYGQCEKIGYAFCVFNGIETKDVVSWTTMISCYINNYFFDEALSLFRDMMETNVEPDAVALVCALTAAADLSSLMKGKEIHGSLTRRNLLMEHSVNSSLVDMYAHCGKIDSSFKIFNMAQCEDLVLWTTMINACGLHGRGKETVDLFRRMRDIGLVPDHITFLALLYACSHSGLVDEGKFFIEIMKSDYGLMPWQEHYACIADLLGRSGRMDEAYEFINSMPVEPTGVVWCALLGACQVHSNHELGEVAARKLLELEPDNPGNYVLISNVFAAMGKWEDVEMVRNRMKQRGLKKDPACTWIELGNEVHAFVARDRSHKESVAIYSKLSEIRQQLEREYGYVADTRFVLHDVKEEEKVKMLHQHSERLAIAFGLIRTSESTPIRITKNLRVCGDCHEFIKLVSKLYKREIIMRDANRFYHFQNGSCSCGIFW